MDVKRFLFCVLFVAIVCTPLTAKNINVNQHQTHRKGTPVAFDRNRIIEMNPMKSTLIVTSGLPQVRSRPVQNYESGLQLRAPHVGLAVNVHTLEMNNSKHTEFSTGKCRSADIRKDEKRQFRCRPRDTVVHLIHQEGLILSPSAVVVKRCDGMCEVHSKCIPTEKKTKKFYIRQSQNNQAACGEIKVEEHLTCSCSCPERQCTPSQIYDPQQCKCICPEHINQNCPAKKTFNQQECKCICKNPKKNCSSGSYFDENKCSCPIDNDTTIG